ncbi:hypothetical protein PNEG_01224 [Pneumocystis murina B123]|uniref:LIM zinc-binding domain-containing protein n=1 Tax=Pneumocystis murina (strain B123) TaxID=1069680 RepID=M7NP76_PNEMU|nr:hypothetical protein PNEG_01224 [Pneumocystis murina B123]EMR10513.1 hypothetical protein PNEG_01224 [Pneumocystis murina B123]
MEKYNSSENYHKKLSEIPLNIAFNTESKENDKFYKEKTFTTENSLMNNMDFFEKSQEKGIPWLCSSCCETFPSNELMYNTTEKQEAYYCKNCHLHLLSKNKNIYPNEISNNNTTSQHQDKNPQEHREKINHCINILDNLQTELNKQSFSENCPNSIENPDEVSLKDSIKNNYPIIDNLTPKVNISQSCALIPQGSMKNSEMWKLLRKKKRNSLSVRKHIENFVEVKRSHNSFKTNIIDVSSESSNFPDKIEKEETLESKISFITLSEAQTNISQENIPPILPSTKNYKNKLFLSDHIKFENNALSTIDYNSFSEKDTFSRHLKDSLNNDKQQFLCYSCKMNLTGTIIQITKEKKYHENCFKCNICNIFIRKNEYIFYKNNICHEKCMLELKNSFLSNSISPKKALTSNTISNIKPLKNNSSTEAFSVKKKSLPKFGGFDKCASCSESITFLESYPGPNSTKWHKKCLKCSGGCGKNMDSGSLNEIDKDGKMKVYCRFCWDTIKRGKKPIAISLVMSNTLQDFSTLEENRA